MNSNWFKLVMKMTKVEHGKNLLLKGVPIIFNKGGAKLKIGENVTIKSSFLSNLVGLYSRTIIITRAPGAEIEIGDNVGISGATIYARKKITIGENTCIGGNCKILDNDFHPIEAEARNQLLRDENGGDSDLVPSREIKIGKNCFIGCNSIILKGTVLGDGCVIFKNDFSDNNNKSLEWWINKHNWYSNKEVLDQQMKSDAANGEESVEETSTSMQAKVKRFVKNHGYYSLPKFFRAHLYFIYRYYFRLGFLDGTEGKIYTFLQAYWYRYLVDAKLYECEKLGVKMKSQGDLKA